MTYGKGENTYELADWHARWPADWTPIEVNGLAIDSQYRLYAFNTGEHPVSVFDGEGNLLDAWGEGLFEHNHGAIIVNDIICCADDGDHTVQKFTLDGKLLMTLGTKGQPSDTGFSWVDEKGGKNRLFQGPLFDQTGRSAFQRSNRRGCFRLMGNLRLRRLRQRQGA